MVSKLHCGNMTKIGLCVLGLISICVAISSAKPESPDHGAGASKGAHYKHGVHNPAFDMDALYGSHSRDDLADLKDDVRKNRLRILAKSHDKNKDGIIDEAELKDWVIQSFKMLDHEDGIARLAEDDEDHDGKVTFAELLHRQYGYTEEEVKIMDEKQQATSSLEGEEATEAKEILGLVADDRERFAKADLDHDGSLTHEEFLGYLHPYDHPHMFDVEVARAVKDMDKNKDGLVTLEEFVNDDEDDDTRLSEKNNFEDLDKDKDGKLNTEELRPWAIPDNADIADEEVQHLMKECDEDEDGRLSVDEIIKKEEEFLGSTATDYGRHLHFIKDEL